MTWVTRRIVRLLLVSGALRLGAPHPQAAPAERDGAADAALIRDRLVAAGFENVRVRAVSGAVVAHVENRTYRWQVRGVAEALRVVCGCADPADRVILVVRRLDVPLVTVGVRAGDWLSFVRGGTDSPRLTARVGLDRAAAAGPRTNSSLGRLDVVIGPGVRLRLVTPAAERGVQWRLNPGLEIALARGLGAEVVQVIPLDGEPPLTGRAVLSQVLNPAQGLYLVLAGGQLDEDRRGWTGELAWVSEDGRYGLGLAVTSLSEGAWGGRTKPTALGYRSHRTARPDFEVSVWAGQFADGDRGAEVALTSRFRDWAIAVFRVETNWTRQAGVALRIPLGPPVQPPPGPVRARLRDYFNFRYRAPDERGGYRVTTGHALADLQGDLLPVRVIRYLGDLRGADAPAAPSGP